MKLKNLNKNCRFPQGDNLSNTWSFKIRSKDIN